MSGSIHCLVVVPPGRRRSLALCSALFLALGCATPPPADFEIDRPDATLDASVPVSPGNLYLRASYWPQIVIVDRDWRPEGADSPGGRYRQGVLVRVRPDGALRVDFSASGVHWVPADRTDVIERANRLRTGQDTKLGPNLAVTLDNRLYDSRGEEATIYRDPLGAFDQLVLVYADPRDERFEAIARAFAALAEQVEGAGFVLVPRGGHHDVIVFRATSLAGWPGAFISSRYATAYEQAFVEKADASAAPVVQRLTPEGRLLFEADWDERRLGALRRALAPDGA